jgi:hypothetical protein
MCSLTLLRFKVRLHNFLHAYLAIYQIECLDVNTIYTIGQKSIGAFLYNISDLCDFDNLEDGKPTFYG